MIKQHYTGNSRRAMNLIWNAAQDYDWQSPFLAFYPNGETDDYMNIVIGLSAKWLDAERITDFFERLGEGPTLDEASSLLWLGIENCVYGKELSVRPHLEQMRKERAQEFFRIHGMLSEQQMAGGIICLTDHADLRIPGDIPIVSIDRVLGPGIPCVTSDNYSGGYLAAQKLMENGCRSLAYLCAGSSLPNETDRRRDGFVCACTDAGVPFESMCVHEVASCSVFEDFIRAHLHDGRPDYDGLFCATDLLAHQILHTLNLMGLRVPQNVQIISYGGLKCFRDQAFRCSAIVQPVEEMAQLCVDLILQSSPKKYSYSLQLPVSYAFGGTTCR